MNYLKRKYGLGFHLFLLICLFVGLFIVNIIWTMFVAAEINTKSKRIKYTYGLVFRISTCKSYDIVYANTIIQGKKYIVSKLCTQNEQFNINGFYVIKYLCHKPNFAIIEWNPAPIDSSIVFHYFESYNISFSDSIFTFNSIPASNAGGSNFGIIKEIFSKHSKTNCSPR